MMYKLYIGSNNKTHKLEKAKAIKLAGVFFTGFTATTGKGYWKGKPENTLILEIDSDKIEPIYGLIEELKQGLQQERIGLAKVSSLAFI